MCREYYERVGRPAIIENCGDIFDRIAVGLAGEGSECFGYDDDISEDHDFGPSFCIWLTDEDYEKYVDRLRCVYSNLPKEYKGVSFKNSSAYSDGRRGVMRIGDFYEKHTGSRDGIYSWQDFLMIPDYSFATAVNGEVFEDRLGEFLRIRELVKNSMPRDIKLKKLAARAAYMAQSGQYNYERCIKHGEIGAATIALAEFAKQTCMMIFLLNNKFCPYYKWMLRAAKEQKILGNIGNELEQLLAQENSISNASYKVAGIEKICQQIIAELKRQNYSEGDCDYLEKHAFNIMSRIDDEKIRTLHVMQG